MIPTPSCLQIATLIARLTVLALTPQNSATSSTVIGRSVIASDTLPGSRFLNEAQLPRG